ncbi:TolC family protein [Aequorivita capsosiphonis]|uniref:TolC family protein n=1 Tax=Aequorivita capsosiphonis TaxID=487317 RepID=UPI00041C246B|nr:TolC family protein [Aequorivita capsosiphonis]
MNYYKRAIFALLFLFITVAQAQEQMNFSRQEAEAIFLKQNLSLIAEKLEIPKAHAAVLQAKLWPNPTLSVSEVNLWATDRQKEVSGEELPPLFGDYGKHQQFGVGIEQLIQTAGKRKKLMALEQVSADKAEQYFEDLLRNLKAEFRNQLTELQFLQFHKRVYDSQIDAIKTLTKAYEKQVNQGHIPKGEFIRLKALELQFSRNSKDIGKDINSAQKELKQLMRLPAEIQLMLTDEDYIIDTDQFKLLQLESMQTMAKATRSDLKIAELDQKHYEKLYAFERAQRVPDITFKIDYDRGGNILYNFVGFGFEIDLPIFNQNQGNIKAAKIGMEQSEFLYQEKTLAVENELIMAYKNLSDAIAFFESINPDYEATLDSLLENYTKNFGDRNISLLEYIDFLEAYMSNKKIILEAGKELHEKAEALNYVVGQDIIN